MSLLSRLIDPAEGEEKIAVHSFMAALGEYARGAPGVTLQALSTAFDLSASEQSQLGNFLSMVDAKGATEKLLYRTEVHDVLLLGEAGLYDESQVMSRLLS